MLELCLRATVHSQRLRTCFRVSQVFYARLDLMLALPMEILSKLKTDAETFVRLRIGCRVMNFCLFLPILDCLNFILSPSSTSEFEHRPLRSSTTARIRSAVLNQGEHK